VTSSQECRDYADECLGWARTAHNDCKERIFLQMAEAWLQAASLAERREKAEGQLPGPPR